ncbi:FkbM family methyltransferase [Candidatus Kaiserbacteria bacterium]|nr:FkbM family methyltransferase [Candidatus Kaiserbacteria bacterium]
MKKSSLVDEARAIDDLFSIIPEFPHRHATSDPLWRVWNRTARECAFKLFGPEAPEVISFGPFGELAFPFVEMGSITSVDLFGMDELIIFSFYNQNRNRYRRVVDFGANIGLHTTILSRCGFDVRSFEPDPRHIEFFKRTISANSISVDLHQSATSVEAGEMEFVRVLGNTTGSHLSGAKRNPYGELDRFLVKVEAAEPHLRWADLAKIDIEGHEAALIEGLPLDTWTHTDAIMEVGTPENAGRIFERFKGSSIRLFSQKRGWALVRSVADMPESHRDGSLFVTQRDKMPWCD